LISRFGYSFLLLLIFTQLVLAQVVKVQSVEITGNKTTKAFVILRELVIDTTKTYSKSEFEAQLEMSKNRLLNLNLFNAVTIKQSETTPNKLLIEVIEKWYLWPIPFVEFSDRNFNVWSDLDFDKDRTNFGLYMFTYNLWGRNHTLKTSLVQGYNKNYGLEYRIPFLFKNSNWGLTTDIHYKSQAEMWLNTVEDQLQFYRRDSTDVSTPLIEQLNSSLLLSKRITPFHQLSLSGSYQNTQLDSSINVIAEDYLLDSSLSLKVISFKLTSVVDKRNNIYFPTTGSYLSGALGINQFVDNEQPSNVRIALTAQGFKQIKQKWFGAISLFGEYNSSKILPYEYTRRLGYANMIRGFERKVIDGNSCALANASLRYQLVNKPHLPLKFIPFKNYNFLPFNMYLGTFVDCGYVDNRNLKPSNTLPNEFLYSTGVSLQSLFYNDRVLRLEYSINSLKESGFFVHFKKAI
jgi:outer membrane protein assembly factor BamA